jgi:hypothetical protein
LGVLGIACESERLIRGVLQRLLNEKPLLPVYLLLFRQAFMGELVRGIKSTKGFTKIRRSGD